MTLKHEVAFRDPKTVFFRMVLSWPPRMTNHKRSREKSVFKFTEEQSLEHTI